MSSPADDQHTESAPSVVTLANKGDPPDITLVGGKGENLARLVDAGFPVPDGFCVTTAVYRELIDDETIREMIQALSELDATDTDAVETAGAALRTEIRRQELTAETRKAIETALENTETDRYAVRSSATAEDLPSASFAGQQETYLNIPRDEVIGRVRDCVASLFTDRAIAYRARNDVSHEKAEIAVVVQRQLTPDASGILFTADPVTGNRRMASIEAGRGLGEALVSGETTGDTVRIDRKTGNIEEYEIGAQQQMVRSQPEGGTETVEIDQARNSRVLTDEQVHALTELGTEIEALFDCPQDIEWCLTDGEVQIVQARPITSLFPVPSPNPTDGRLHAYVSMGHGQAFAEAMPPLVCDLWMAYMQESMTLLGFGSERQWAAEAGGRVYVDITPLLTVGLLRRRVPELLGGISGSVGVALGELLARRGEQFHTEWTVRSVLRLLPQIVYSGVTGVKASYPLLRMMLSGFIGSFIGAPTPPRQEEAKWNAWGTHIATQMRAPDTPTERANAALDMGESIAELPSIGSLYAALAVDVWLRRWAKKEPSVADDVDAVGRGFPKELVTRINVGLGDLADVAREHPEVTEALRDGEPLETIESKESGEAFADALDSYLSEFGHRATGEMDVSRPRWREDPSGLLETVRANQKHEEPGGHREHIQKMQREASQAMRRLEAHADHGVLGPIRKRIVHQLLRTYRGYIRTREYPKHGTARMFAAWHDVFSEIGEQLADEGVLEEPEDVWFLRKDELLGGLDGGAIDADIDDRRAEFERHKEMDAPPVLTSEGEAPSAQIERDAPEEALVGTGVSGGVVEGPARIVRDPTEETVENGEILIAPSSDPGWTPLFLNAAGMVVEVGGRMSHGALVAREYGLPAVVSVPEATRRIETGQQIRIDGAAGTVEPID